MTKWKCQQEEKQTKKKKRTKKKYVSAERKEITIRNLSKCTICVVFQIFHRLANKKQRRNKRCYMRRNFSLLSAHKIISQHEATDYSLPIIVAIHSHTFMHTYHTHTQPQPHRYKIARSLSLDFSICYTTLHYYPVSLTYINMFNVHPWMWNTIFFFYAISMQPKP